MRRRWRAMVWNIQNGRDVPDYEDFKKDFWTWWGAHRYVVRVNTKLSRGILPYRLRVAER